MTEHQQFLDAIIEQPEDDTHRLVYADYLEEQGDERGDFIRLQCERERLIPNSARYKEVLKQEEALLRKHGKRWSSELGVKMLKDPEFARGFVRHVELRATQFLKDGDTILQKAPLEMVRLPYLKGQVGKLADAGLLERLRGIDLSYLKVPFDQFELLLYSMPRLIRLRANSSSNPVDEDFAKALYKSDAANSLQHLQLANSRIHDGFYSELESQGSLPSLKSLTFGNSMMGGPRPKRFDKIKWPAMEEIRVHGDLRVADMQQLAALGSLKKVQFRYTKMPERGLRAMIESGSFKKAEQIIFHAVEVSHKALKSFFESDLSACRYLELGFEVELDSEICQWIKDCDSLSSLELIAGDFEKGQRKKLPSHITTSQLVRDWSDF